MTDPAFNPDRAGSDSVGGTDPTGNDHADDTDHAQEPPPHPGSAPRRKIPRGLLPALAVTALLALYIWAVAGRGVAMIGTGMPILIAIGVGILVIPLLVLAFIAREFWLAARVQAMADELAAAAELPVDDLPRSPGGRIDRAAADSLFGPRRAAVEADPANWRTWYHLAFAYDAAGDRRRARATLRRASKLYRR